MQYNGRCGCHFLKPTQTSDYPPSKPLQIDPESVAELPAAGKVTFYVSKNRQGMRKDFDYQGTPVIFNNPYRQTLDESGKPLLKSIFSGAFQNTDKPDFQTDLPAPEKTFDILRERKEGKRTNIPKPCNLDIARNVPLMQSTLTGAYYGEAHDMRSPNRLAQKPSLIEKYRRSMSDYSNVVRTVKPAKIQPREQRRFENGGAHQTVDPEIPKTENEVLTFYEGCPTTQTAAVMAKYLTNCSRKERIRFARSVRTSSQDNIISPTRVPSNLPPRSLSQNSVPVEMSQNKEQLPGTIQDKDEAPPSTRLSHQQALTQATRFVQSRGVIPGGKVRPISVSEAPSTMAASSGCVPVVTSPASAGSPSLVRVTRRRAENMHKDLQVSAFGATFATTGLSSLEQLLKK